MSQRDLMRREGEMGASRRSSDPLERLLGELGEPFGSWLGRGGQAGVWTPAVNIEETDEAYLVSADLPGMSKDDVELSVENNVVTISGERKWDTTENRQLHRVECGYGCFTRSFVLPRRVTADKVEARFDNGILRVTIPKDESSRPRRVQIS